MNPKTLDDCDKIFREALSSASEAAFCHNIDPLFNDYEILSVGLGRGTIFWRARPIETEIYPNISDLKYPPPEKARQGRLNDLGTPCFYTSAREETALAEVGSSEGQLVQLAGFRALNEFPIELAIIGEYANVQKSGYMHFIGADPDMTISRILNSMPRRDALRHIYIDKFLAETLADPNASSNGYMFSRAMAQAIYSKIDAKGIAFPSVKDRGGFNIAVQAESSDKSFHNVCCLVIRMGQKRDFGLIDYEILQSAEH